MCLIFELYRNYRKLKIGKAKLQLCFYASPHHYGTKASLWTEYLIQTFPLEYPSSVFAMQMATDGSFAPVKETLYMLKQKLAVTNKMLQENVSANNR